METINKQHQREIQSLQVKDIFNPQHQREIQSTQEKDFYNPQHQREIQTKQEKDIYNPTVPFSHNVKLFPSKKIFVGGILLPNSNRFTIDLECGPNEIAFRFDVRINHGNDKNTIVTNAKLESGWGTEERFTKYFPFSTDKYSEVTILVEEKGFKVAVNNHKMLEFEHRMNVKRIDNLCIKGDNLKLTKVSLQ